MTWIQTYTGNKFSFQDPQPEDVHLEDIIQSLSKQSRYLGHTLVGVYTVAQHSVLVSHIVSPELQLDGLFHDAPEAYYGDVTRPLKMWIEQQIGISWRDLVGRIDEVVASALGVEYPIPQEVKEADDKIIATEKRDLMAPGPPWCPLPEPCEGRIKPVEPATSATLFRHRYQRLLDLYGGL